MQPAIIIYVFERYVQMKDGQPVSIPCSGYERK